MEPRVFALKVLSLVTSNATERLENSGFSGEIRLDQSRG